jgi:hypothetical protein
VPVLGSPLKYVLILATTLVGACEYDKTAIPRTTPQLALHGVLSASAVDQVVLLERTNSGRVQLNFPAFDLEDAMGSDSGIAETGALMTLTLPGGGTLVAQEDNHGKPGQGEGVYRFGIIGPVLKRNETYRLTVITTRGEQLTAETSVPDGTAAMAPTLGTLNRAVEALTLDWPASPTARSYYVWVEGPYGPMRFFTESTHVQLPGLMRNTTPNNLPHVFFPGFTQAVTVSAVDSNFYDWFRTFNNLLTSEGLINRVSGGLGVFGSLVRLRFDSLQVTAPQTQPVEGHFELDQSTIPALASRYLSFDVYIESPAARRGQSDALSGRYRPRPRIDYHGCPLCGLLGTARNGSIELVLLNNWSAADTVEVFDGTLEGDTLTGFFRHNGGPFKFVRQ